MATRSERVCQGRVSSHENGAVWQSHTEHRHCSRTGVHTSTLVWIRSALEADLLALFLHAVIPIMEQHMNSIPARCR